LSVDPDLLRKRAFKEDSDADSSDLVELVMGLESASTSRCPRTT